jgi:excisionase family DNA binding protein
MTAEEVAELLRTSRAGIYARVARGQLSGVRKLGRSLLFEREVLLESLQDRKRAPSPRSR